jgi:hypothetical protein
MSPLILCDSPARRAQIERELAARGWRVVPDPTEPHSACDEIASIAVSDEAVAASVVSRAVDGEPLLVQLESSTPLGARVADALQHVDAVIDRRGADSPLEDQPTEVIALLAELQRGKSVTDAAAASNLSRRTAYRLLEQCRLDLRVATVRELTLLAQRLLPPAPCRPEEGPDGISRSW